MKLFKYFDFVNERLGVSDETVKYSDVIMKYIRESFEKFYEDKKLRIYKKVVNIEDEISNFLIENYHIHIIKVNILFRRIHDQKFMSNHPVISRRGKYFTTSGGCYTIKKTEDGKNYLELDISATISRHNFKDVEGIELELESTILHELNHSFEGFNRLKKNKPIISTAVTWAIDVNAAKVPKSVWNIWWKNFAFYIYWSERHELNAMIQDTLPYVRKYSLEELTKKSPSWDFYNRMLSFDPKKFKETISLEIKRAMPNKDPELVLEEIKNGLADTLENFIKSGEYGPDYSLDPNIIRKLSIDEFLDYCDRRIKKKAEILRRGILRLYSTIEK